MFFSPVADPLDWAIQRSMNLIGSSPSGYPYMPNLRMLDHPPVPSPPRPLCWPQCPSPVCISRLAFYLEGHPDQEFATFIIRGLSSGFHIGYSSRTANLRASTRNHPSSAANRHTVSHYIAEETAAGRMSGPLSVQAYHNIHCSPIGLVPKGRGTGQWRMIVDLSYPTGRSVNDGIPKSLCTVSYASIDDAVCFITTLGRHTLLLKVDLKSAYRIVPVHPQDRHLLGICWEDRRFVDQALPFGLRSAPVLFSAVADAISWALLRAGAPPLIHYLDDFLFFLHPSEGGGSRVLQQILHILESLGVPVAMHKIEGPSTSINFLGILVDTSRFELRLPPEKILFVRDLVQSWRRRRSGRASDFESFVGHLAHAATVIRQGRTFLRHLYDLLYRAPSRYGYVHLDAMARADLLWWEYFLQQWNGTMFFKQPLAPAAHIYTDASGSFGCGGVLLPSLWFQVQWPPTWVEIDIVTKELVPIVAAAALWGRYWSRTHVCFHTDNMAVVAILRNQSGRSTLVQHLMRCLYFYTALYQFEYTTEHVPGVLNVAADAISRNNISVLPSLIPQATQVSVPPSLLEMLVSHQPDWGSATWITSFMHTLSPQ